MSTDVEDDAEKINYEVICPICGKERGDKPDSPCNKKAIFDICPVEKDAKNKKNTCHNKNINGKEDNARSISSCLGCDNGSHGNGQHLGKNMLSGSDWQVGKYRKLSTIATLKMTKGKIKEHYLYTGAYSIAAHHLICSEAIDNNEQWKKILEMTGYNINCRWNGVFLPATAALACHTGLQRHAGPHDLGDAGGKQYVLAVKTELKSVVSKFRKENKQCSKNSTDKIIESLNALSEEILENVKSFTWTIAWDSLTYDKNGKLAVIGCANSESIDDKAKFLKEEFATELKAKGLNFNKEKRKISDMQELAKLNAAFENVKCNFNRDHNDEFKNTELKIKNKTLKIDINPVYELKIGN